MAIAMAEAPSQSLGAAFMANKDAREEFDIGPAGPLESFYDPVLVQSLRLHQISEEPPLWVIDSSLVRDSQGQHRPSCETTQWIDDFIEFVEAQSAHADSWEPFNVKNALHSPPERFWIDGCSEKYPTEKLVGLQAFLKRASGSDRTFLDKGRRFAIKRYPHNGAPPANTASLGGNLSEFYPAENLHIDRLQKDADHAALDKSELGEEARLRGDPTHFTLVVNFDDESGGTLFPNGRLCADPAPLPEGVSVAPGGGFLVQSRRGRAVLWSNHRGTVGPSGKLLPLFSSLHQSVLRASTDVDREARRVCIFGWAESGRKWERCGFHECLDHEPPSMRARFFNRTLLEELQGWEDGPRAAEVPHHLAGADVQREIREGFEQGTMSEERRAWLANFGYTDKQQIFQMMVIAMADGQYDWQLLTISGDKKFSFKCKDKELTVRQFKERTQDSYICNVHDGRMVTCIDVFDHLTQAKITDEMRKVQQGEQIVVGVKTLETTNAKREEAALAASFRLTNLQTHRPGSSSGGRSSEQEEQQPVLTRGATEHLGKKATEDKTTIQVQEVKQTQVKLSFVKRAFSGLRH